MYAIIATGGKQYRVQKGDVLKVDRLEGEPGATLELPVLFASGDGTVLIGTPTVEKATVKATLIEESRDRKVLVFKKKRRKQYKKMHGHRQYVTQIQVDDIVLG